MQNNHSKTNNNYLHLPFQIFNLQLLREHLHHNNLQNFKTRLLLNSNNLSLLNNKKLALANAPLPILPKLKITLSFLPNTLLVAKKLHLKTLALTLILLILNIDLTQNQLLHHNHLINTKTKNKQLNTQSATIAPFDSQTNKSPKKHKLTLIVHEFKINWGRVSAKKPS